MRRVWEGLAERVGGGWRCWGVRKRGANGWGEGGEEEQGKGREPGRANRVPKPQLPSSDIDPGNPSREYKAPTVAVSNPQAAHELADQPRSRGRAIRRQPTPIYRPLMPMSVNPH
jgi:hypothetical protein